MHYVFMLFFFFQAEDGIRDGHVTGVQTCALPISPAAWSGSRRSRTGAPPGWSGGGRRPRRRSRRRSARAPPPQPWRSAVAAGRAAVAALAARAGRAGPAKAASSVTRGPCSTAAGPGAAVPVPAGSCRAAGLGRAARARGGSGGGAAGGLGLAGSGGRGQLLVGEPPEGAPGPATLEHRDLQARVGLGARRGGLAQRPHRQAERLLQGHAVAVAALQLGVELLGLAAH